MTATYSSKFELIGCRLPCYRSPASSAVLAPRPSSEDGIAHPESCAVDPRGSSKPSVHGSPASGRDHPLQKDSNDESELAYFSWFYGGASLGTGGKFSSNGTFAGAAKLCPPGGTN